MASSNLTEAAANSSTSFTRSVSTEIRQHPFFSFLKKRSPYSLGHKANLLFELGKKDVTCLFNTKNGKPSYQFSIAYSSIRFKDVSMLKRCGADQLAEWLIRCMLALEEHDEVNSGNVSSRTRGHTNDPLHLLREMHSDCQKKVLGKKESPALKEIAASGLQRGLAKQTLPDGRLKQDLMKFDNTRAYVEYACPSCNNQSLNPLTPQHEIDKYNKKIQEQYDRQMEKFNNKEIPTKPKKKRTISQELGCFAYRMNCQMRNDGVGCVLCETVCKNGDRPPRVMHSSGIGVICACTLCQSNCSFVFYRHHWDKVKAAFLEMEENDVVEFSDKENNVQKFQSMLCETIQNSQIQAKQDFAQASCEEYVQNGLSLAAVSINRNPYLHSDVHMRKDLQSAMPRTAVTKNGQHIDDIRKKHLPAKNHTKNPLSALSMKDSRFVRNRLSKKKIIPSEEVASARQYIEIDQDSDPSPLCKKSLFDNNHYTSGSDSDIQVIFPQPATKDSPITAKFKRVRKRVSADIKSSTSNEDKENKKKILHSMLSTKNPDYEPIRNFVEDHHQEKLTQEIANDIYAFF